MKRIEFFGRYDVETIDDWSTASLRSQQWDIQHCYQLESTALLYDPKSLSVDLSRFLDRSAYNRCIRQGAKFDCTNKRLTFSSATQLERALALHARAGCQSFQSLAEAEKVLLERRATLTISLTEIAPNRCIAWVAPKERGSKDVVFALKERAPIYWCNKMKKAVALIREPAKTVAGELRDQGYRVRCKTLSEPRRTTQVKRTGWRIQFTGTPDFHCLLAFNESLRLTSKKAGTQILASCAAPHAADVLAYLRASGWKATGDLDAINRPPRSVAGKEFHALPGWGTPITDGTQLRDYQRDGVLFVASRGLRAIIGDEMGTGKTAQAIAATVLKSPRRVLIVAPLSVITTWRRELLRWAQVQAETVSGRSVSNLPSAGWLLTNYESLVHAGNDSKKVLSQSAESLTTWKPDVLIIDEAHRIANASAKRTKAVRSLANEAQGVLLLTGSPIRNDPKEFASLAAAVDTAAATDLQRNVGSEALLDIWPEIMIRRRKDEVLNQLPPKIREVLFLPISADTEMRWDLMDDLEARNSLMKMRHELGRAKVESAEFKDFLQDAADNGPLVIFTHHREVLERTAELLLKAGHPSTKIVGGQTEAVRTQAVDDFSTGRTDIALVSIEAGGEGIDLSRASRTVFVEWPWVPATVLQAEDRLHRYGQKQAVNIYQIIATPEFGLDVDQIAWHVLNRKLNAINQALGEDTSLSADICKELIHELRHRSKH